MSTIVVYNHADVIDKGNKIIRNHTFYAAGVGFIPIPVLDAAAILGIQLKMIHALSKEYGIAFKQQRTKVLITTLIGDMGTVGLVKLIPGIGMVLGGVSGAAVGGATTYALGRLFLQHFDQGGTFLDFDPVKARTHFQKEFEAGKLLLTPTNLSDESTAIADQSIERASVEKVKMEIVTEQEEMKRMLLGVQEALNQLTEQHLENDFKQRNQESLKRNEEIQIDNTDDKSTIDRAIEREGLNKTDKDINLLDNSVAESIIDKEIKREGLSRANKANGESLEKEIITKDKTKSAPKSKSYRQTIFKKKFKPVDLKIVEGIGPKVESVLKKGGIINVKKLGQTPVSEIKRLLKEAGGNFNLMNPKSWPEQAALAAEGKMEELQTLQEKLVGGKIK